MTYPVYTWLVQVAFEGLRVGQVFEAEETIRMRMLRRSGYLARIESGIGESSTPVVVPPTEEPAATVTPTRRSRRRATE